MFKNIYTIRIMPDKNIPDEILNYCKKNKIKSGVILSMIGSLKNAELGFLKKLPGMYISKKFTGPLEIVCGTGTIAQKDDETLLHVHIQISDEKKSIGGHLICATIFSTAEIVIGELDDKIERYKDKYTGLNELKN